MRFPRGNGDSKGSRSPLPGSANAYAAIALQWCALLACSLAIAAALELARVPAALLLGPMLAAIAFAIAGARTRVSALPFGLGQSAIGCLIARSVPVSVFGEIGRDWPVFLGGVVFVIAVAGVLGYALARFRVFAGSTAVWGSSPGAADAMVLLAGANGADVRLVAFMQYLRVVCVAIVASIVSHAYMSGTHAARPSVVWFVPLDADLAVTLAIALGGLALARAWKIPAGALLVPLSLGIVVQLTGVAKIALPESLLAIAYAVVGWGIGQRFDRAIVAHIARAFPRVLASIAVLVAVCGAFAAVLVRVAHVDPLTAYLATSPGGADSVAIIAANSRVDAPFVMTMQTARFVVVLLVGPALSRFIARRTQTD